MNKLILSVLTAGLLLAPTARADEPLPRLVSVSGEGEVYAVPDEVWVNFLVESFDEKLAKAKEANDEAIRNVLALAEKYKIDSKDFRTDHLSVRNEERYYFDQAANQQKARRGFFVTKNVAVILRDVAQFEALYSEALESGVNNLSGVEFKSSRVKELRDEARKLAVQDAKTKAVQLAAELGQEISRPYQISESAQTDPWPRPMMMAKMALAESGDSGAPTIALGQIKVVSSVSVSFELK